MTQLFKVLVNGLDKTENISGMGLSKQINRMYDVSTFACETELPAESDVEIFIADKTFSMFVFSSLKNGRGKYNIECRSYSAKLTEPYFSSSDYVIEDATTAYDLCAKYETDHGITITNNSLDLNFGGNYERRGTVLAALTTIANVTGSEFWHDDTGIVISPNKEITEPGTPLIKSDIFDFVPFFNTIENKGVKVITVGVVSQSTSVTTAIKCSAKVDECTGETMVRVVPHSSYLEAYGISLDPVRTRLVKVGVVGTITELMLDADISEILSVNINGALVTDYTFKYDTIAFDTPKRGIMSIEYYGWGYRGYANIQNIDNSRYAQFDVFYGGCDAYQFQSKLDCNGSNSSISECLGTTVIMPNNKNYPVGFSFQTMGDMPSFQFYTDIQIIHVNVVTTVQAFQWVEKATLSTELDGTVKFLLRFTPASLTEVRSKGTDITSHASLDGRYLILDKEYPGVLISYEVTGKNHYVKFTDQIGEVTMLLNGECPYQLEGTDYDSTNSTICIEGASVAINMVEELAVSPNEAANKLVTVTAPDGTVEDMHTDSFGVLHLDDVAFGTYKIVTTNIKPGSRMSLIAGG